VIFAQETRYPRYLLRVPVRFQVLEEDEYGETEFATETVNISPEGFFMRVAHRMKVGSVLTMHLRVPTGIAGNALSEIPCTGRIAWEEHFVDGTFGYDVEIEKAGFPMQERSQKVVSIRPR
jgi:hypothetical protein